MNINGLTRLKGMLTLYRLRTSVVNFVASYHARRLITWVISVRRRGRTMCFFLRGVCKSIRANAGMTSLDKLTPTRTTPFTSTCNCKSKQVTFNTILHDVLASIQNKMRQQEANFLQREVIQVTFIWCPQVRSFSAAFKASKPPSSWPTKTTERNPISEQNEIRRSTCT